MKWIKPFFDYLSYLLRHKWLMFWALWRKKLYWQAIIHDWSKFMPDEAVGYIVRHNYDEYDHNPKLQAMRQHSQVLHDRRSPHQWGHWLKNGQPQEMPPKYLEEMLLDWKMSFLLKKGRVQNYRHWYDWYFDHKPQLAPETKAYIEKIIAEDQAKNKI